MMLEKEKMETAGKKQEIDCLRIEICSLKEDLDIQEQLHLQVKKKKSYYKSQVEEKDSEISQLSLKSSIYEKIKEKIKKYQGGEKPKIETVETEILDLSFLE